MNDTEHPDALGFVGFGEAAFGIASGLREAGLKAVYAYDLHVDTPGRGELIRKRAQEACVELVSTRTLAERSGVILSEVTADQASAAASQTAPFLTQRHIYADLNSVSPEVKKAVAGIVEQSGARFVEAAVMASVTPHRHQVPMLLNGKAAKPLAAMLEPFGMRLNVISEPIGAAAAVKLCRSIVIKGLEALLVECVLASEAYGADERVLASLEETFPGMDWKQLADYMVGRAVVHGRRRAAEMDEAARTVTAAGLEPIMSEATARRHRWCDLSGVRDQFGPAGPSTYREAVEAWAAGGCIRPLEEADGQRRFSNRRTMSDT